MPSARQAAVSRRAAATAGSPGGAPGGARATAGGARATAGSARAAPGSTRATVARGALGLRPVGTSGSRIRIRWDRAGRAGLLVVLTVVAGLYVQHALTLFATHSQAQRQLATVQRLARENAALAKQSQALSDPHTIERDARRLGMVRPGERPYVITGMPQR